MRAVRRDLARRCTCTRQANAALASSGQDFRVNVWTVGLTTFGAWLIVSPANVPVIDALYRSEWTGTVGRAALIVYYCSVILVALLAAYLQLGLNKASANDGSSLPRKMHPAESAIFFLLLLFWSGRLIEWNLHWPGVL